MTSENPDAVYACQNYNEAYAPKAIAGQSLCIGGDTGAILNALLRGWQLHSSDISLDGFDTGVQTTNDAMIGGLIGMTVGLLDAKLSAYDAVIARFDAEAVAEEVDRAYEKQYEMARQARMQLRKEKKEEIHEELKENMDILSANFTK